MRLIAPILLVILIAIVGYQVYKLSGQKDLVGKQFNELKLRLTGIVTENNKIGEDLKYYSNRDNLEKEARSQLNYMAPDEKTIIVIPKAATSD